jgi:hypothetical protein
MEFFEIRLNEPPPNIFTHSLYPCHCTNINYTKSMRQHFMHFKSLFLKKCLEWFLGGWDGGGGDSYLDNTILNGFDT